MSERRAKPQRNLEEELDKLLAEIEQKIPDLQVGVASDPSASAGESLASRQASESIAEEVQTSASDMVPPHSAPPGLPAAQEDIAALIAQADDPSRDDQPVATKTATSIPSTAPPAVSKLTDSSVKGLSEEALSAQIQSLLDQSLKRPSPVAAQPEPTPTLTTSANEVPLGDFATPQEVLSETSSPPTTSTDHSAIPTCHPTGDVEVAQILQQIDEDLSKQADQAVAGEFETVQEVTEEPSQRAADSTKNPVPSHRHPLTEDPTLPGGSIADQVAAELDSQPERSALTPEDDPTPIPTIPPEVLAAATAPAPPPLPAKHPSGPGPTQPAHSAVESASRKRFLHWPAVLPTLRAILTLLNAPLINANPAIRHALGLLGLGNLMLGSMWVLWLLLTRH